MKLLREFVRNIICEANIDALLSQANRDSRGVLIDGQKVMVIGQTSDGVPVVDAYAGVHRAEVGWQISFLWGKDARASVVVLLACLDNFGKISADTDMSPAARAVVDNYYKTYKDDETKVLNFYLDRGMGDANDAIFLGPIGLDLKGKQQRAREMIDAYAAKSRQHPELVSDELGLQASQGFRKAYDDDLKTGRTKKQAAESLFRTYVRSVLREYSEDDVWSHLGVKGKPVSLRAGDKKSDSLEPELFDIISKSYEPIGGHAQLSSRADVTDEYPEWVVADIDDDPEIDVAVVGKTSPQGGIKVGASGTDGSSKAKNFMNTLKSKLLTNGWWGEVSGAPAYIAIRKLGLRPITDQETVERLLGKKVKWVGENPDPKFKGIGGWYTRMIGGHDHMKIIVGDVR